MPPETSATAPYVRPDVAAILALLNSQPGPAMHEASPAEGRAAMTAMVQMMERPRGELAAVSDLTVPAGDGYAIPVRLYRPTPDAAPAPVLLYFHGGGWVIGDLASHDSLCAEIARGLSMTVLAVDYRMGPEFPFPKAVDDCLDVFRWLAGSPDDIGHSVTGIVPAGDSAGGNLTAVTAQALAGTLPVPILAQWLIYPATDMTDETGSMMQFGDGHLLTKATMDWFMHHYMGDADRADVRASPLKAASLAGQPPALVYTCSLDPLRDQGRAYAGRLIAAGVRTIFREAEGQIHGSATLRAAIPSAHEDLLACLKDLKLLLDEAR